MKKGISLIILVITIIVIIILAGAVILSLSQNNPIAQSSQATFKATAEAYNSELTVTISSKYAQDYTLNSKSIFASTWDGVSAITGTVKEFVPSITVSDAAKYIIQQGKLAYIGTDSTEKQYAADLGFTDQYVKSGLILWLQGADFKNSPQTTSLIDRSGKGKNATPFNFSYTTTSGSDGANSIAFDGVDDRFTTSNIVMPANNFTVSAWVYVNAHNTNTNVGQIIMQQYSSYYGWIFSLNGPDSKLQFRNHNGTSTSLAYNLSATSGLNLKTWYYVTGSDDGTTVKLYINGSVVATCLSSTAAVYSGASEIGSFSSINYLFNGKMREIQVYNRALTDAEVLQNYNASK